MQNKSSADRADNGESYMSLTKTKTNLYEIGWRGFDWSGLLSKLKIRKSTELEGKNKEIKDCSYEMENDVTNGNLISENDVLFDVLSALHNEFVHKLRDVEDEDGNINISNDLANGCRNCLAKCMGVSENKLHCSIKRYDTNNKIFALARSTESTQRYVGKIGGSDHHQAGENSAFAAITAVSDRYVNWEGYRYPFFISSNLTDESHQRLYCCSRGNWEKYYKSVAVFPIGRVLCIDKKAVFILAGFLTFDSIDGDMFANLPDAFDYRERVSEYYHHALLHKEVHLCGLMADSLWHYLTLKPNKEANRRKGTENEGLE